MTAPQTGQAVTPEQQRLLQVFAGQYGRLCILVARALTQGHDKANVIQAALGKGSLFAPVYVQLRREYDRSNRTLWACKQAGVTNDAIVQAGLDARYVVSQEWMIQLPAFSEAR